MAVSVGLDIGQGSVKAVALKGSGASITLARYAVLSRQQLRDEGIDDDDPAALGARIANWLKSEGFPTSRLQVAVAGRDSIIRYSNLPPMPPWRLQLLMEYEIAEVAEKAGESLTADFAIVPAQTGSDGFSVLVALAKDSAIEPIISSLAENQLDIISGSPAAVAAADTLRFLGDPEKSGYSVVVNIGKSSTDVAVLDSGVMVFARTITSGSDLFTRALSDHFDIDEEDAENCKLETRGPDGEGIGPILSQSMRRLASSVKSTLNYMKGQLKLRDEVVPRRVFVTGGGARLPALARQLGEMMNCPAEVWDPLAGIETTGAPQGDLAAIEEHGIGASVACGLALKNLLQASSKLDLLPQKLREKREWSHRTRWLIAAGALLLVQGLLTIALTGYRYSGEEGRRTTLAKTNAKTVNGRNAKHKKRVSQNNERENYLASLASHARAGRQVQRVLRLVSDVLPRNMVIVSIDLQVQKRKADPDEEGPRQAAPVKFLISGQVDNTQLNCEQELAELAAKMESHSSVAAVSIDPTSETGAPRVNFEIELTPKDPEG